MVMNESLFRGRLIKVGFFIVRKRLHLLIAHKVLNLPVIHLHRSQQRGQTCPEWLRGDVAVEEEEAGHSEVEEGREDTAGGTDPTTRIKGQQ